jgi:hypothetical protein
MALRQRSFWTLLADGSDVVIATIASADTWKPVDREPYSRATDVQVINAIERCALGQSSSNLSTGASGL